MSGWDNSDRRERLPADWPARRAVILARDPRCRCGGCTGHAGECRSPSTEVDHIRPGDDHRTSNLQGLCGPCHLAKTIAERPKRPPRKRPAPRHPGVKP